MHLSIMAGNTDNTAVLFNDCLRNRKAQTVMLSFAVPGFVNTIESVEEMRQLFLWNLVAIIDDRQDSLMSLPFHRQFDFAA